MPPHVAVVGSIVMDLVVRAPRFARPGETVIGGPFATLPGGKGANQAVAAARLGAEVSIIGCVGDDEHGIQMLETLAREGIDVSAINTVLGAHTGVGCITIDRNGENAIVLAPGANFCVSPDQIDQRFEMLREADAVLMQLEVPMETIEYITRRRHELRGRLILNAAPAVKVPDDVLSAVDILIVNETEAAVLARRRVLAGMPENPANEIERLNIGTQAVAIITRGARGALALSPEGSVSEHEAFQVEAVDTTGAGDAFCAALAVALTESSGEAMDLDAAMRFACAAGALACTRRGAIPSMPVHSEVRELLAAG